MHIFPIFSRQFEMDAIFMYIYLRRSKSRGTFNDYTVYGIVSTKRDQADGFQGFNFYDTVFSLEV